VKRREAKKRERKRERETRIQMKRRDMLHDLTSRCRGFCGNGMEWCKKRRRRKEKTK
jgi:hypothetical protein